MYVQLPVLTQGILLAAAQVAHVVVDVDVGGGRLAAESFHRQGHAPLSPPPGRATLGVDVLLDAVPVVLRDAEPVNQVTCKRASGKSCCKMPFLIFSLLQYTACQRPLTKSLKKVHPD